jgi:hypothetical protein
MLGQVRPNAALWRFAIAPGSIDPVISAMSTLWDGQTDRHGGNRPTTPIAPDAAHSSGAARRHIGSLVRHGSSEATLVDGQASARRLGRIPNGSPSFVLRWGVEIHLL